jgi:gamma-glutamylcyclotransferase (GGCT)/AIG2-like uncharacterized protein YtfP
MGYKLGQIENSNQNAVELSGDKLHYIAIHTGAKNNKVAGTVFEITTEELKQADRYESPDYKRVMVNLHSGLTAWLYVSINETRLSSNEDSGIETAITA